MKNKIKRIIGSIFLVILFNTFVFSFAQEFSTTIYSQQTNDIDILFKNKLSSFEGVTYINVPQGLVVSVNSGLFFEEGKTELLNGSKIFLFAIAEIIKLIPNNILVEGNSDILNCNNSLTNWELSTIQAGQIVKYLIKDLKINPFQIQSIGFGEYNPNLLKEISFPNRIDFVILNYETN